MPHRCIQYNKNAPTRGCNCDGCKKQREIARRSNVRTRIWNTKGHSKEHPNREDYLARKRKYKEMRDDTGLPRHICPNCATFNENILIQIDKLQKQCELSVATQKAMLDRIPDIYPEYKQIQHKISLILNNFEKQKKALLLTHRNISDTCHEPIIMSFKNKDGHMVTFGCGSEKEVSVMRKILPDLVYVIEHQCKYCNDPILESAGLKRPFVWQTTERIMSGFGDQDFTFLGTSSIDKKVSNEDFIKRQIRYYHLTSYYKDCHSHESKGTKNLLNDEPKEQSEDIGEIV